LKCPNRCINDLDKCQFCAWHCEEECKNFKSVDFERMKTEVRDIFVNKSTYWDVIHDIMEEYATDEETAVKILYYRIIRAVLSITR